MFSFIFIFYSIMLMNIIISLNHPIILSLMIIMMSLLIGVYSMIIISSWFFYLLILIFLGGVMILIMYMSTLTSNEKFIFSPYKISIIFMLFPLIFYLNFFYISVKISKNMDFMNMLYNNNYISSTLFLMFYLLLILISIVNLIKYSQGVMVKRL